MQRILQLAGREIPERPRILEINPNHSFVQAAQRLATEQPDSAELTTWIELLFDQANLAEGHVVDPIGIVKRIQSVLDKIAMLPRQ
jgi:molecular chaperone HtpG